MSQTSDVIYTARTHTEGGRDHGVARSSDAQLDVRFAPPGSKRTGTNPEQMFAAGWSACFEGAIELAALRRRIKLPADVGIDAEVDLHLDDREYFLSARLDISIPGVERNVAQELVEAAETICPYSKAISGNVAVTYRVV
jgi:Ohr subfamily peroxiredoxin